MNNKSIEISTAMGLNFFIYSGRVQFWSIRYDPSDKEWVYVVNNVRPSHKQEDEMWEVIVDAFNKGYRIDQYTDNSNQSEKPNMLEG